MRWFDCTLDETIIDNYMLNQMWLELTLDQRIAVAKASAMLVIPDAKIQRRAYVFTEPEHRYVGVFDPETMDVAVIGMGLLTEALQLSVYVLENTSVVDFYRVNV